MITAPYSAQNHLEPPQKIETVWKNARGNNFIGKLKHLAENFIDPANHNAISYAKRVYLYLNIIPHRYSL